jgi:hypothetical protein
VGEKGVLEKGGFHFFLKREIAAAILMMLSLTRKALQGRDTVLTIGVHYTRLGV